MELSYPARTVWYIEARSASNSHPDGRYDSCGSGVVVRLRKRGESSGGQRYLLTCAHVISKIEDLGGKNAQQVKLGGVYDDIRVWAPGKGFAPDAAFDARVATDLRDLDNFKESPLIAVDDWVILDIQNEAFRKSAPAVRDCAEPDDGELMIVGYAGGASSFVKYLVTPTVSDDFRLKQLHERTIRLHGDESRSGMSGGGLFSEEGDLVGIHRSRSDATLECQSLSAVYIFEELAAAGYELVDFEDGSTANKRSSDATNDPREDDNESWWLSRRKLVLGGSVAMGAIALAAIATISNQNGEDDSIPQQSESLPTKKPDRIPLAIGIKGWVGYAPLAIIKTMDLCKDLDISFVRVRAIADVPGRLRERKIQMGMWLSATHVINRSSGVPAKLILKLDDSYYEDGIVVKSSIQSALELKNTQVMYQKHDAGHCMLLALCRKYGFSMKDFSHLKHVAASEILRNFSEDYEAFSAATTYEPDLTDITKTIPNTKLLGRAKDFDMSEYGIVDALVVHEEFLESHKEAVESLIEGWFEAVDLLQAENHDAIEIARDFMGEVETPDPIVSKDPMDESKLMEMISEGHVELAGRQENYRFFHRDQDGRSPFRTQYEYFKAAWKDDLGIESTEFVDADGSQEFLSQFKYDPRM